MTATVYAADSHAAGRSRGRWKLPLIILLAATSVAGGGWYWLQQRANQAQAGALAVALPPGFQPNRAMRYLEDICAIGPRVSGTEGMQKQQQMLLEFFRAQGAEVALLPFQARHPLTGKPVAMNNLIARFFPDQPKRILLCAHYDTRPFPDRDPTNPRGVFVGANDGASGTAALMEVSHHLSALPGSIGIDIVLFDGEELVYQENRDEYFLGSTHFARSYAAGQIKGKYEAGALLDMVGDRELSIYYEANSLKMARPVCQEIWGMAKRLKIDAFQARSRHEIRDDHLPLNNIGKIPTADLIDFDYPRPLIRGQGYWHTTEDTPDKCSGLSLASVAAVVVEWLKFRSGVIR